MVPVWRPLKIPSEAAFGTVLARPGAWTHDTRGNVTDNGNVALAYDAELSEQVR